MAFSTIGDLRQHFLSTQANTKLKTDLNTLVEELTTGEKSDLTEHLGSSQVVLNGLDRQLSLLGKYEQVNSQTSHMLSTMQSVLTNVDTLGANANEALLTISDSSSISQVSNASNVALSSFEGVVASLNTRYGDRSLFGGTNVDGTPLASADIMLADLKSKVSGLSTSADVSLAIDNWFEAAGGGFETVGYQGDAAGFVERPLDQNESISISARADDEAVRDTLKALAKGILATDNSLSLDIEESRNLLQQSASDLHESGEALINLQANLGFIEGRVEEVSVRTLAEQTSFGIARSEMVSADPFETASRLQAVQTQLETHYSLTARLSSLSLSEYLR